MFNYTNYPVNVKVRHRPEVTLLDLWVPQGHLSTDCMIPGVARWFVPIGCELVFDSRDDCDIVAPRDVWVVPHWSK